MQFIILSIAFVATFARPDSYLKGISDHSPKIVKIISDNRIHPHDGSYSFDFETEDGIKRSESGSKLNIEGYPTGQQGEISFPLPDGQLFNLKFVANEKGYQPESPFIPVAPKFPHPIPQFVLDQIEKARLEDLEDEKSGKGSSHNQRYLYEK